MDAIPTPAIPAAALPAVSDARQARSGSQGLFIIAIFELVKTVLFIAAAMGVFHLVKRDTQVELTKLLHVFRVSGDRAFIKDLLLKANVITDPNKRIIAGVLLLYAALHATEGIGLLLRKRWAEYITVIMTSIFIPYEVYLLVHHTAHVKGVALGQGTSPPHAFFGHHIYLLKIAALVINSGIVWYLAYHLRRSLRMEHAREQAARLLPAEDGATALPTAD